MQFINLLATLGLGLVAAASPVMSNIKQRATRQIQFLGVNLERADFYPTTTTYSNPYNLLYTWYNLSMIDDLVSNAGSNTFRIDIRMENMTPSGMNGTVDTDYLGNLTVLVNYITEYKSSYAIITPYNYGRYQGQTLTPADLPAFEMWWNTVAGCFKENTKVLFDTNNEYHDYPGKFVADLNQAAINGIRAAGATTQYITVEGNAYTEAQYWTQRRGEDGLTNSQTLYNLTDPSDNLIYQMHQFLDATGEGSSPICATNTTGGDRLSAATTWLRDNKKLGLLGEFAGGANPGCVDSVRELLGYIEMNCDVWTGALWYAAGKQYPGYMFDITPSVGVAYETYAPILKAYSQL